MQIDPTFAPAYVLLGQSIYAAVVSGWSQFFDDDLDRVTTLARHALLLDPATAGAHRLLGNVYLARRMFEPAERAINEALALNPSDLDSRVLWGAILMWTGRSAEAVPVLEAVLRADPGNPTARMQLALSLYSTRRYEEAVRTLQDDQGRRQSRLFDVFAATTLAMAQAQLGRDAAAAEAATRLKRSSPFFDAEIFAQQFQDSSDQAHATEGLVKAGIQQP
jgi:adenylate cyclase